MLTLKPFSFLAFTNYYRSDYDSLFQPSAVGRVALVDLAAPSQLAFDDDDATGYVTPPDTPITDIQERYEFNLFKISSSSPSLVAVTFNHVRIFN